MQITATTNAAGVIRCETLIDGRHYKAKFRNCGTKEARQKFRRHVIAAENRIMDEQRQEVINACLTCTVPAEKCKGNCKIETTIKIKRGKGIL